MGNKNKQKLPVRSATAAVAGRVRYSLGTWTPQPGQDINAPDFLYKLIMKPKMVAYLRVIFQPDNIGQEIINEGYWPDDTDLGKSIAKRTTEFSIYVESLAQHINKSRRFMVFFYWQNYILEKVAALVPVVDAGGEAVIKVGDETYHMGEVYYLYKHMLGQVYLHLCRIHGKMLVGTADNQILWVDMPYQMTKTAYFHTQEWLDLAQSCMIYLSIFTGRADQQMYDRLMFPVSERWPRWAAWGQLSQLNEKTWLEGLSRSIGFTHAADCTKEMYEKVLADTALRQNRMLVEDRPVLVKLEGNDMIDTLLIMKKEQHIIAKLTTYEGFEIIENISLQDGVNGGWLSLSDIMSMKDMVPYRWTLPFLLAQVYRDLVVAEVKHVRKARKAAQPLETYIVPSEGVTGFGKPLGQVRWKLIPQRVYLKNAAPGDDDTGVQARPLTPKETTRKRLAQSWSSVRPFARKLPEGWKVRQSDDYREEFQRTYAQFNIQLDENTVAIRPQTRNKHKFEEFLAGLSEQEIKEISALPHYLKKSYAKA